MNEKYRKSFFLFVNDREGNAFTKENLSFLNKKKCNQRKDVKRRGLINMSLQKQKIAAERGITLLALIITVVILIILAAVTINITLNSGLINQAKQAGEDTMQAAKDEQQMLDDAASYINEILADTNKAKTLVQAFKDGEIQVGDYVDYEPDPHDPVTVGTDKTGYTDEEGFLGTTDQTYSQDTTNTHWRVLGLTEDGNSVMLLGSPIKQDGAEENSAKQYLWLEGATGYKNGEDTLNRICGLYYNNTLSQETRSIKVEDINRALGGITVTYPKEGEFLSGTVTLNTDSSKTDIGWTTEYSSYTYESGDYSPESYPNEVSSQIGEKVQANAYYYKITDGSGLNYSYMQGLNSTISERGYNMLFEGTTEAEDYVKLYWLASTGIDSNAFADFGIGNVSAGAVVLDEYASLFNSYGYGNWNYSAVRPVVILKSDVTVNDVHKIEDQTEEVWQNFDTGIE